MLDGGLSSPERNLRVLRTRLSRDGQPSVEGFDGASP
jgi:hypothetical protein